MDEKMLVTSESSQGQQWPGAAISRVPLEDVKAT